MYAALVTKSRNTKYHETDSIHRVKFIENIEDKKIFKKHIRVIFAWAGS